MFLDENEGILEPLPMLVTNNKCLLQTNGHSNIYIFVCEEALLIIMRYDLSSS